MMPEVEANNKETFDYFYFLYFFVALLFPVSSA